MTKTCSKCGDAKPLDDFYLKRGKPMSWCKACNRARNRLYWALNAEKHVANYRHYNRSLPGLYSILKHNAEERSIPLELTMEQYAAVRCGPCHYCGGALPPSGAGVDRKDSRVGYTPSNCVACCTHCNCAKGTWWTYEEFVTHIAPGIRAARRSRLANIA